MIKRLIISILLLGSVLPAAAQDTPRPATLVRAWAVSQQTRAADLEQVELRERSEWINDGPFRMRRTRMEARIWSNRDTDGWEREVLGVEVDGRRVPVERWQEVERLRGNVLGRQAEEATRSIFSLQDQLEKVTPAGETTPDVVDGVPAWRVELVPRNRREVLERFTLWFARDEGHLIRSRAVVRARRIDPPLVVATQYERLEGFDVPVRRRLEGSSQIKRRLRTYTVLYTYTARYDDYRFFSRR